MLPVGLNSTLQTTSKVEEHKTDVLLQTRAGLKPISGQRLAQLAKLGLMVKDIEPVPSLCEWLVGDTPDNGTFAETLKFCCDLGRNDAFAKLLAQVQDDCSDYKGHVTLSGNDPCINKTVQHGIRCTLEIGISFDSDAQRFRAAISQGQSSKIEALCIRFENAVMIGLEHMWSAIAVLPSLAHLKVCGTWNGGKFKQEEAVQNPVCYFLPYRFDVKHLSLHDVYNSSPLISCCFLDQADLQSFEVHSHPTVVALWLESLAETKASGLGQLKLSSGSELKVSERMIKQLAVVIEKNPELTELVVPEAFESAIKASDSTLHLAIANHPSLKDIHFAAPDGTLRRYRDPQAYSAAVAAALQKSASYGVADVGGMDQIFTRYFLERQTSHGYDGAMETSSEVLHAAKDAYRKNLSKTESKKLEDN